MEQSSHFILTSEVMNAVCTFDKQFAGHDKCAAKCLPKEKQLNIKMIGSFLR